MFFGRQVVTSLRIFQIRACSSVASTSKTIRVPELKKLIQSSSSLRLLDASYSIPPFSNKPEEENRRMVFKERNLYGKVDELAKLWANADYEKEHIPGAVHFNSDVATFPGEFTKQDLYEPEIFQKYARKLGINQKSDIIVYSRGAFGGMLFAARTWWLLKVYGAERVRVLEGGLPKWKEQGEAVTDAITIVEPGNFVAREPSRNIHVSFEELFSETNSDGKKHNLLDARPKPQFTGAEPPVFPRNGAPGAHLEGAKNLPLSLLTNDGELKSAEELSKVFDAAGVSSGKDNITFCNVGFQASLLGLALAKSGRSFRVFNGSLLEVSQRKPSLISAK